MHIILGNLRRTLTCAFLTCLLGATVRAQGIDPDFRIPPQVGAQVSAQIEAIFGESLGTEPYILQFFSGQTTVGQFLAANYADLFEGTLSSGQATSIASAYLSGNYSSYLSAVGTALAATGWTQVAPTIWSRPGVSVELETQTEYDLLFSFFSNLTAVGDLGSSGSDSVTANVVQDIFTSSIFEKVTPGVAKTAKPAAGAAITTVFGADAFYTRTKYDSGASAKIYGTNLSMTWGDKFQFRGTVPLYKADFAGSDATTYGLDLNGKYNVSETFSFGAHANYLKNDTDFGNSKSWTAGLYAALVASTSETSKLSIGALFDRLDPQGADSSWLGALGINWGFSVGQNSALNPYVIYYRQFDVPSIVDKDWYDVGLEWQVNLNETWGVKTGLKATFGQDGVKSSYQAYLGSAWRF